MIEPGAGAADHLVTPGIFARIFPRPTAREVAVAVSSAGFSLVQLNLSSFGAQTVPDPGDGPLDYREIGRQFDESAVRIWGLSATFNMAHPDPVRRRRETAAACDLVTRAGETGASFVTLCTGSRDPVDMWHHHADNDGPEAWTDMRASLDELLDAAARGGVRLGVEPEAANVVSDAARARRLLDELGPDGRHVGIVLDPANLLASTTLHEQVRIMTDAFDVLGAEVVCIHAKDVADGGFSAPGSGALDFELVYRLRQSLPNAVPVVIQDTAEADAGRVREYLVDVARRYEWQREP